MVWVRSACRFDSTMHRRTAYAAHGAVEMAEREASKGEIRMRFLVLATMAGTIAFAVGGLAKPPERSLQVRGEGCVEPGVETRCLVVKDVKTGSQFNLF